MFGLGWLELLIIGGAIMLLAGPVALKRLVGSARALEQTKRDLSGPGALDRFLGEGEEEDGERRGDTEDRP